MIISKIEQFKYSYKIYVDDQFVGVIRRKWLKEHNFREGEEVQDMSLLRELIEIDEYESAKNKTLRQLGFSQKTEKEVIQKLKKDCFGEKTITKTLNFLREYNFVNDDVYANFYTENTKRAGKSKRAIKNNLIKKGFSKEIIENSLEEINEEDELENAMKIATKKLKSIKSENEYEIAKKLKLFLASKGFDYSVSDRVVRNLIKKDLDNF